MSREIEMSLLLRVGNKRWKATAHGISADELEDTKNRHKRLLALSDSMAAWVKVASAEARRE